MSKILITLLISILFYILPNVVHAQKDYEKGMVITNEYDTLFGYVKDRKPYPFPKLYKKIKFKRKKNAFAKKYSPRQIKSYTMGSAVFESLWIDTPDGLFGSQYENTTGIGEQQFLKVMVKGPLTYYQWEFIEPEFGHIDRINLYIRTNEGYFTGASMGLFSKGKRLKAYFQDCPELISKIESKELKYPADIADFYNRWYLTKKRLY